LPRLPLFLPKRFLPSVQTASSTTAGADCRPKNLRITDRGKPQPVNQEVAREPEQDQANPDEDGRDGEPDHGTLPWCLRFGSGNPDRHGLIIAEMRDACRLIRGRDCAAKGDADARSSVAGTARRVKLFRTFGRRAGPADPSVSAYFYANLCTAAFKLMPWPWRKPIDIDGIRAPWVRSFVQSGGNLARHSEQNYELICD
jgi:hypothetical protein